MEERMPYERVASSDMMRYQREQRSYQEVQRRYTELRAAAEQDGTVFSSIFDPHPSSLKFALRFDNCAGFAS